MLRILSSAREPLADEATTFSIRLCLYVYQPYWSSFGQAGSVCLRPPYFLHKCNCGLSSIPHFLMLAGDGRTLYAVWISVFKCPALNQQQSVHLNSMLLYHANSVTDPAVGFMLHYTDTTLIFQMRYFFVHVASTVLIYSSPTDGNLSLLLSLTPSLQSLITPYNSARWAISTTFCIT